MVIKDTLSIFSNNKIKTHLFKEIDALIFYLSIFILPISINWSSKLLFISFVLGLIKSINRKDFSWFKTHKFIITIFSIFLLYIFLQSILIDGFELFFKRFDKGFAPYLVFLFTPIFLNKKTQNETTPKALIFGLFALFILIILMSIIHVEIYNREKVLEVFDIHHLYVSLYILFAINFYLSRLLKKPNKKKIKLYVFFLFSLFFFLFFFKSKAAIVISFGILFYHILLRVKLNKLRILVIIIIVVAMIYLFDQHLSSTYFKALNFRIKIWNAAISSFFENPIFGYGSLNEHNTLNYQHFVNADYGYLDSNFNSHNQYLSLLLKFGLLGFLIFITPFLILIKTINKTFQKEYVGFLLLISTMAYIESFTNRHHGIVFIAVILYYYNSYKHNEVQ